MTCQMCKRKPATGIIFAYCDDCFKVFEKKIADNLDENGMYSPTDEDLAAINEPFIDRSKN